MKLAGTFQITDWQESVNQTYSTETKLTNANVTQTYNGDIDGHSTTNYIMYYLPSGDAIFTGFERIEGTINDVKCLLTLRHNGEFKDGKASSHFVIIESISMPELIGITGTFISGEAGLASFTINNKQ